MQATVTKDMSSDITEWKIVEASLFGAEVNDPYGHERNNEDEIIAYGLYEEVTITVDKPLISDCFKVAVELIEKFIEEEKCQ